MSFFRGGKNGGNFYSNVTQPVAISLNFTVDHTNGNGLGIRSLKSNGWVRNVFMNTSVAPGTNNGALNPNPLAGFALVQLKQNFNIYLGGFSGFVSPVSGTPILVTAGLTIGQAYIIVAVGTTTQAQWQTLGLPAGLIPTVGQSFIAITAAAGVGTGVVEVPAVSGITSVEVIGNPNTEINNSSIATNGGAYLLVQFLGATDATHTALIPKAPVDGSVCGMTIIMDQSSADPIMQNGDPSSV